jgi:hypothetical protein
MGKTNVSSYNFKARRNMDSILKKLYYGILNLDEDIYSNNLEYRKLSDQAIEVMELLKKNVPEKDYKIITSLLEIHNEIDAFEVADAFEYGFKYGSLIMMEVLKDN